MSQATHANRRIRGSPLTHDTAGGQDFSIDFSRTFAGVDDSCALTRPGGDPTRERGRLARMLSLADGNAAVSGLAFEGTCCRRLRGSTLLPTYPWAYAHGYLLAPLRGSTRIPGIRKPAPDHRPSRLPVREPFVLVILLILCIDVHKKIDSPAALPLRHPTRERGRPARMLFLADLAPLSPGLHSRAGAADSLRPFRVDARRGDSQRSAGHGAGGTPALPGGTTLPGNPPRTLKNSAKGS